MNNKSWVKLSNIIGTISIIMLVYWVFVFTSISVFGLKVFRENITETFYLSVLGILALMVGALIINVMFNLTRIAEKHNQDHLNAEKPTGKKVWLLFGLSFVLVFGLLFGGDYLTSRKKEKMLIASAKEIIESNKAMSAKLLDYSFNSSWIFETENTLNIYSNTDVNFPNVSVIVADSIENAIAFLEICAYNNSFNDTVPPLKNEYIFKTTKEERAYLFKVFYEKRAELRFSASEGKYELFYPFCKNGKCVVLYFSDYQRFGKMGY
jgi:hypothetical protein